MTSPWGVTPRRSVEDECSSRARADVVARCREILSGRRFDAELLQVRAGPHALHVLAGGEGGQLGDWPRVWALRGLRYAWENTAIDDVVKALHDESWRVRKIAVQAVVAHNVTEDTAEIMRVHHD